MSSKRDWRKVFDQALGLWCVYDGDRLVAFGASEADADRIIRDHELAALCLDVHEKRTTIYGFLAKLDDALTVPVEEGEKG